MEPQRILLVGKPDGVNLESSYERAFQSLGHHTEVFALQSAVCRYARFGRFGRTVQALVPIEQWRRKANRELVVAASEKRYDLIVVFGSAPVQVGALAQIRAGTNCALVWIWPDTLLNLEGSIIPCLQVFDILFTYSRASAPLLKKLSRSLVVWLPLAGDRSMHQALPLSEAEMAAYRTDISFIGGWRPERESALLRLIDFDLKVWGPEWDRRCNDPRLRAKWQRRALLGSEFAKAASVSRINLNIIDQTNFPAANMRFFELPIAGGLQISSPCPEMAEIFEDDVHLCYYQTLDDLPHRVKQLLDNEPGAGKSPRPAIAW